MPNVLVDYTTSIMSMRIRNYVSASIGSFRDRSRSRNRRRAYQVNGATSNSNINATASQPDLTYQSKRRSQIIDVGTRITHLQHGLARSTLFGVPIIVAMCTNIAV